MSIDKKVAEKMKPLGAYYAGKTAVITGGTSGIGLSTALLLAQLGSNVLILARTRSDLDHTIQLLNSVRQNPKQKFQAYQIDLRNVKSLVEVAETIQNEHQVDILFNNAGVYFTNYFEHQSVEQIESMVLTNVMAPLQLTRSFVPHFLKKGGGQVVNISSLAAKLNFTGYGVYGGTKAGMSHSSKGLQFEYAAKKISFSDFFAPDSLTRGYQDELKTMPEETKRINGTVKPLESIEVAYFLLEGVSKRQLEIIPGAKSKAISFLAKHLPTAVIQKILHSLAGPQKLSAKPNVKEINAP